MITRKGFKMLLYPGMAKGCEGRHNESWPEMKEMIQEYGGSSYSIYLDEETSVLYGYLKVVDGELWAKSTGTTINRKWWDFMADIMETSENSSSVYVDLTPMFHLD